MASTLMNVFALMMLMILLVLIQVESLPEPFCEIKCDAICIGKRLVDDWNKCVKDCKETKC